MVEGASGVGRTPDFQRISGPDSPDDTNQLFTKRLKLVSADVENLKAELNDPAAQGQFTKDTTVALMNAHLTTISNMVVPAGLESKVNDLVEAMKETSKILIKDLAIHLDDISGKLQDLSNIQG